MNKRPFEQAVLKVESLSDSLFTKKLTLEILTKRPERDGGPLSFCNGVRAIP
jgi:hypothetical protein